MKRQILLFVSLIGFIFTGLAQQDALLWKVTGKNPDKPSYLYGTIHIQAKEVFAYDTLIYDKMRSCEALAVELIIDEIDPESTKELMLMEEGSIADYLSDEEYHLLDSVMKARTGQPLMLFEKMKPFFLSSQIMQTMMPKEMPLPLDMHFIDTARKMDKNILALEELSDQIGAIEKMSVEEQVDMLMDGLTDEENSMEKQFTRLVDAYVAQDLDSLQVLMRDTALPESFGKELIVNRNKGMAKALHKIMKKQSVFAAFGAAHLVGEKGVIELLRQKGYEIEPVRFDFAIAE
ncbi:MAG: TraB/GumN family protein [Bacteroidota bacterium]|nr:TraB/GumN family protein [Bacteroidota bacterium]